MDASEFFPGKYMKADDYDDHPIVTIRRVIKEEVGTEREIRPILFYEGEEKGIVLNKTNTNTIRRLYGDETDDWIGMTVQIGTEMVSFNGETKPAIRIWPPRKTKAGVNAPLKPVAKFDDRNPPPRDGGLDEEIPFAPEFR